LLLLRVAGGVARCWCAAAVEAAVGVVDWSATDDPPVSGPDRHPLSLHSGGKAVCCCWP
jgi:hypothetical protein